MSAANVKCIPTSSQTVGPFFTIGLQYLIDRAENFPVDAPGRIRLSGRVLDAERNPVPDAMLEFWGANSEGAYEVVRENGPGCPQGFRRTRTNGEGCYKLSIVRPGPVPLGDGTAQAPHLVVLVFARGLMRNLLTRVYLPDPAATAQDLVLNEVPAERRPTLVARPIAADRDAFLWDVVLQGREETVFFAW